MRGAVATDVDVTCFGTMLQSNELALSAARTVERSVREAPSKT